MFKQCAVPFEIPSKACHFISLTSSSLLVSKMGFDDLKACMSFLVRFKLGCKVIKQYFLNGLHSLYSYKSGLIKKKIGSTYECLIRLH